jgi:aspartate/methionine/tyrosine aminotransferase
MIQVAKRLNTVEEYYFSKKLREVAQLTAQGKSIINMGIGSPDMSPSSEVLEALR